MYSAPQQSDRPSCMSSYASNPFLLPPERTRGRKIRLTCDSMDPTGR
jgi:hypothetical protein